MPPRVFCHGSRLNTPPPCRYLPCHFKRICRRCTSDEAGQGCLRHIMPGQHHISPDLKLVICNLFCDQVLDKEDVKRFAFSRSTLLRAPTERRETGLICPQRHSSGGHRFLAALDAQIIRSELHRHPLVYLDELQNLLWSHAVHVSLATISRHLGQNSLAKRKLARIAWERQDWKIWEYLYKVSIFSPEQLVFLDKSSFDARTTSRLGGRGSRGDRFVNLWVMCNYWPRYSLVAGLHLTDDLGQRAIMAPRVVEGSVNSATFRDWIHKLLKGCNYRVLYCTLTQGRLDHCLITPFSGEAEALKGRASSLKASIRLTTTPTTCTAIDST